MYKAIKSGLYGGDESARLSGEARLSGLETLRDGLRSEESKGQFHKEPPAVDEGLVEMWMELRF